MIRIALIEDQTLVREGIESLLALAPDLQVVVAAADGIEARKLLGDENVDVVLLDLRMPRMSGLELLESYGHRMPPTIILTTFDDDEYVVRGIRAGARGYLLKDVGFERLVEAIRLVAAGGTMIQPVITERIRAGFSDVSLGLGEGPVPSGQSSQLTPRELDVVRLMAAGYSNREIAHALDLAQGTVKNHISSVLAKLGVRDRTRAVLNAIEHGLI